MKPFAFQISSAPNRMTCEEMYRREWKNIVRWSNFTTRTWLRLSFSIVMPLRLSGKDLTWLMFTMLSWREEKSPHLWWQIIISSLQILSHKNFPSNLQTILKIDHNIVWLMKHKRNFSQVSSLNFHGKVTLWKKFIL